jgi:predicted MFS family arabinose efflux permease
LDVGAAIRALATQRRLRLATLGYLGLMWELYALWSWLAVFLVAARQMDRPCAVETGTVTFLAIGAAGLVGAVAAGRYSDRLGRTAVTSAALVTSAACCLASPLAFGSRQPVLIGVLLVWGASVIAD